MAALGHPVLRGICTSMCNGFGRQARREKKTWLFHGTGEIDLAAPHAARLIELPGGDGVTQRSMAAKDAEIVQGTCGTSH